MKVIRDHDEEEDFVEVYLTADDLEALDNGQDLRKSYPAMFHSRRKCAFLITKNKVKDE